MEPLRTCMHIHKCRYGSWTKRMENYWMCMKAIKTALTRYKKIFVSVRTSSSVSHESCQACALMVFKHLDILALHLQWHPGNVLWTRWTSHDHWKALNQGYTVQADDRRLSRLGIVWGLYNLWIWIQSVQAVFKFKKWLSRQRCWINVHTYEFSTDMNT